MVIATIIHTISIDDIHVLHSILKLLGLHDNRTKLYIHCSTYIHHKPLSLLHSLILTRLDTPNSEPTSPLVRPVAFFLGIYHHMQTI